MYLARSFFLKKENPPKQNKNRKNPHPSGHDCGHSTAETSDILIFARDWLWLKKKINLSLLKMLSCLNTVINIEFIFRQKPLVRKHNESGNALFLRGLTFIFVSFILSLLMAATSTPQSVLVGFLGLLSCEYMHHRTKGQIAGMASKVLCHLFCEC